MSSPLSANCRDNIMDSIGHGKVEENSHDSLNALEMWSWRKFGLPDNFYISVTGVNFRI